LAAAAALLLSVAPSQADEGIGAANIVINSVRGNLPSSAGVVTVVQGDGVFRDEGLRTNSDSSAKLVLLDNTNLSLGPSSSVKLDRFVYAGPAQVGSIAINLTKGIFRFATGDADKRGYAIMTPTASIGVRGTILRIIATKVKTTVILDEGAVIVCTRAGQCLELTKPGEQAVVTATRVSEEGSPSDSTSATFAAFCGQAGVCETTLFSELAPNILPPPAGWKGGGHATASSGPSGGSSGPSGGSSGPSGGSSGPSGGSSSSGSGTAAH
jgi:hypothetical protein